MVKHPNAEAKVRAAKHAAKVKQAEKRAAQKARGKARRGSDPDKVTQADLDALGPF